MTNAARIVSSILLLSAPALGEPVSLSASDSLGALRLSAEELREVTAAVELSAYDTPESWTKELRARRVDLGTSPGIVLQGTDLLCGATGNCQLFVFRSVNGRWLPLFETGSAPIAESFEFGPGVTHGIKNLAVTANLSAQSSNRASYRFDGRFYRAGNGG